MLSPVKTIPEHEKTTPHIHSPNFLHSVPIIWATMLYKSCWPMCKHAETISIQCSTGEKLQKPRSPAPAPVISGQMVTNVFLGWYQSLLSHFPWLRNESFWSSRWPITKEWRRKWEYIDTRKNCNSTKRKMRFCFTGTDPPQIIKAKKKSTLWIMSLKAISS